MLATLEDTRADGHPEDVIDEREEQVLADVPHRGATPAAGPDDAAQIALHERHVGALHGHVRPGLHGNPHVGLCQCRCVIDPVTGHGDDPTLRLQPLGPLWRIQELAEAQERMG